MKKNYKRIFGYAFIMIICVIAIVLMACLSENRLEGYQTEYETAINGHQRQIEALEKEILNLSNENAELKKKIDMTSSLQSELETGSQAMNDMKELFELFKSGSRDEARKEFAKIEPIGFDDVSLAYYELLKEYLK
ncbi:MAG: hypothetical protein IKT39_06060 [Clostridia bacterium]|nr:hypothetical protein [Clostridia bacterium]MBR6524152.1 hypothetical protein [Clostridia bacterium]